MPGIQYEELLILAADQTYRGFGLRQGADVVLFPRDIEYRTSNIREIYPAPTQLDLTLYELVVLIKIADPLAEGFAREWDPVVHPLAHGQPGIHRLVVHNAIPHRNIRADVVGHWLDHPIARIDEFAWHVAECLYNQIGVKILLIGPYPIQTHLIWCEVDGRSDEHQVSQRFAWKEGRVHGTHRPTHTVSYKRAFLGMRSPQHLLHGTGNIVQHIVFK